MNIGGMAERFKAAVLKTAVGASLPWVRIPLPPPVPCFTYIYHRLLSPIIIDQTTALALYLNVYLA